MKNVAVHGARSMTIAQPIDYPSTPVTQARAPAATTPLPVTHPKPPGGKETRKPTPPHTHPGKDQHKPTHGHGGRGNGGNGGKGGKGGKGGGGDKGGGGKTKKTNARPPWLNTLLTALEGQNALGGDYGGGEAGPTVIPGSPSTTSSGGPNIAIMLGGVTLLGVIAYALYQWYEKHHKKAGAQSSAAA